MHIIGVELECVPSMKIALESNERVLLPPARSMAEGMLVRQAGVLPLERARAYPRFDVELISEEEIQHMVYLLWKHNDIRAEGAGASAVAASAAGSSADVPPCSRNCSIRESIRPISSRTGAEIRPTMVVRGIVVFTFHVVPPCERVGFVEPPTWRLNAGLFPTLVTVTTKCPGLPIGEPDAMSAPADIMRAGPMLLVLSSTWLVIVLVLTVTAPTE